jgi:hypothetical protein
VRVEGEDPILGVTSLGGFRTRSDQDLDLGQVGHQDVRRDSTDAERP